MLKAHRQRCLLDYPRFYFSFTHNFHHPPVFYVNGIKHINDYDLSQYKPQI
jgi:hypothetical protein